MKVFNLTSRKATAAVLLAGAAGLATSCKSYLDIEPTALTTTEATFSTVSGATSAVLGAYVLAASRARRLFASSPARRAINRGAGTVMAGAAVAIVTR